MTSMHQIIIFLFAKSTYPSISRPTLAIVLFARFPMLKIFEYHNTTVKFVHKNQI